ncbi:MAG TPA: DNA polymerase III subunit beta [Bacillales bacterium]|nr:DNA polymerase III subunit beta [Bacillales bacterium]
MQLTIQRDALLRSLNHVMKAVSSKTTIPILTGIKMTAGEEAVVLTGSDSNVSIESTIPLKNEEEDTETAVVSQPGSIVLQGNFFTEMIKKLPEDSVEITVDERLTTTIRSGSSEFNLNGLDPQEYPRLPKIDETHAFRIKTDLLKDVIRQTVFAVSTSEAQPVLTGVNWGVKEGQLTCVATDGHRLASRTISVEDSNGESVNVVIPGDSLNELGKILNDHAEWVDFVVTESQTLFKTENLLFFSRLLDDNYPDTNRLIPAESKTDIVVETKAFLRALERTWLLAREDRNNVVKLSTLNDREIEVSSHSPELGKVFEKVGVQSLEGEEVKISFSAKFVMAALRAVDAPEVIIRFTGAMRPFLIQPPEDDSVLQLVLPVRSY